MYNTYEERRMNYLKMRPPSFSCWKEVQIGKEGEREDSQTEPVLCPALGIRQVWTLRYGWGVWGRCLAGSYETTHHQEGDRPDLDPVAKLEFIILKA